VIAVLARVPGHGNNRAMEGDPNFRLKAFAVLACVLGVFFVAFVAQRIWFWMKSRRREDVDTSRLEPIIDFGLLGLGAVVIWVAVEALVLAVLTAGLQVQPEGRRKVAEIEVGRLDPQGSQLNLLFYPVDRAGRRISDQRRPVLTRGDTFELQAERLEWRGAWRWLGDGGYYQFVSLGGQDSRGALVSESTSLRLRPLPRTVGALLFMRSPTPATAREACEEGKIYDIFMDSRSGSLAVELHEID
jgi:hypothetical protein